MQQQAGPAGAGGGAGRTGGRPDTTAQIMQRFLRLDHGDKFANPAYVDAFYRGLRILPPTTDLLDFEQDDLDTIFPPGASAIAVDGRGGNPIPSKDYPFLNVGVEETILRWTDVFLERNMLPRDIHYMYLFKELSEDALKEHQADRKRFPSPSSAFDILNWKVLGLLIEVIYRNRFNTNFYTQHWIDVWDAFPDEHFFDFEPQDALRRTTAREADFEARKKVNFEKYCAWADHKKVFGKNGGRILLPDEFRKMTPGEISTAAANLNVPSYQGQAASAIPQNFKVSRFGRTLRPAPPRLDPDWGRYGPAGRNYDSTAGSGRTYEPPIHEPRRRTRETNEESEGAASGRAKQIRRTEEEEEMQVALDDVLDDRDLGGDEDFSNVPDPYREEYRLKKRGAEQARLRDEDGGRTHEFDPESETFRPLSRGSPRGPPRGPPRRDPFNG